MGVPRWNKEKDGKRHGATSCYIISIRFLYEKLRLKVLFSTDHKIFIKGSLV